MKTTQEFLDNKIFDGSVKVKADIPGVTKSTIRLFDLLEQYRQYILEPQVMSMPDMNHPQPISEERIEELAEKAYSKTEDFSMSDRKMWFGRSAFIIGFKAALKELNKINKI